MAAKLKSYSGMMLAWTAVLHTVVGIIIYWQPLADIGRSGLFNSIGPHYDRGSAFWFLLFGALLFMLAGLIRWLTQVKRMEIPKFIGVYMLVLCLVGVFFTPVSGFWLVIPQALIIMRD
ncbi:DUF6463 family protein [Paenibacillus tyrfis]|uniref:Uncharacterized protein n=1 Tax=Paenibacillus tyrfis TaxID=1501230 RepID=A0A081P405_9BACL|nr:DUF6463 family protein [Paenibacillus tyrfis]KEQ25428.1 hypothetical protein ET33_01510 [Paenibacillus tyrfis]